MTSAFEDQNEPYPIFTLADTVSEIEGDLLQAAGRIRGKGLRGERNEETVR